MDIAKAYDSLEWGFIEKTLSVMGFPAKIVSIILGCIKTDSFLINGQPTDVFYPKRGIKIVSCYMVFL